jgi:pimeloyl-ACP methyl ester carboxylesterase
MSSRIDLSSDTHSRDKPTWSLLALEPLRAAVEFAGMQLMTREFLPTGDGHPVILFPGLGAERHSMAPLKKFCEQLGYVAYDWGRGFNRGPDGEPDQWIDELAQHVATLTQQHEQRISLIGWSLGGIYAREIAKQIPARVRDVITLGTPVNTAVERNHVDWLYRLLNGQRPLLDDELRRRIAAAPRVPTTSIFSRSDGIVAWQACLQEGTRAVTENIEVRGSHLGLGWNSEVLEIIAGRLSQPEGKWRRDLRSVTAAQAMAAADPVRQGERHWQIPG